MKYRRLPIEIEAPEGLGYDQIRFNLSESSFTDQYFSDLGIDLSNLLLFYGDHKGNPSLREWVAGEAGMDMEEVLITPGAAPALFMVSTGLLEKGDHAVIAKANYATNLETPRATGADISYLPMRFEQGFALDLAELESLINDRTKLVSLTYPHNPTGAMIDEETLRGVVALVERKGCYLLIDETYREMSFVPKLPVAASLSENVISVTSMSKAFGLPGIRMGWLLCRDKALMETMLAAKEQIFITNSVVDEEIAFQYLLQREKHFGPVLQTIEKNFAIMKGFMQGQELLEWVEPAGGCVCFPRIKQGLVADMDKLHAHLLEKYRTYLGRGHWFEEDARYLRIGYSWEPTDKLAEGLQNILSAIGDLEA